MSMKTHLTELAKVVNAHPALPFYRVIDETRHQVSYNPGLKWKVITYAQFWKDIQDSGKRLRSLLSETGVHPGDVVTAW